MPTEKNYDNHSIECFIKEFRLAIDHPNDSNKTVAQEVSCAFNQKVLDCINSLAKNGIYIIKYDDDILKLKDIKDPFLSDFQESLKSNSDPIFFFQFAHLLKSAIPHNFGIRHEMRETAVKLYQRIIEKYSKIHKETTADIWIPDLSTSYMSYQKPLGKNGKEKSLVPIGWLRHMNQEYWSADMNRVKYFTPEEKKEYKVRIIAGNLPCLVTRTYDHKIALKQSIHAIPHPMRDDKYTFSLSKSYGLIAARETEINEGLNHSTFFAGQPVLLAGDIVIEDGRISAMNNESGHYKCPDENLFFAAVKLFEKGMLSEYCSLTCRSYDSPIKRKKITVRELLLLDLLTIPYRPIANEINRWRVDNPAKFKDLKEGSVAKVEPPVAKPRLW